MSSRWLRVDDENVATGALQLPLCGKHDFKGVRGGQGRKMDKFQGTTPKKKHRTKLFDSAHQAAVALAELEQNLVLGLNDEAETGPQQKKQKAAVAKIGNKHMSPPDASS